MFCGVRISATGQLIKRSDYKPSGEISDEEWRQRMTLIQRVADELRRFSFPGEAPSLQVKFAGDLSQFETARAEATLHGDRVQRGALRNEKPHRGRGMDQSNPQHQPVRMGR